jgi:Na+-transporting methylmalonyl-CoA/oxaloacetate decarboxylase gamma subunit
MSPNLLIAIQITVVGMALVFAAIILLWGLMALLVRVLPATPEPTTVEVAASAEEAASTKRRAAIAAVAVAMALAKESKPAVQMALPPTATVSAWQAAMRANRLNIRGPVR